MYTHTDASFAIDISAFTADAAISGSPALLKVFAPSGVQELTELLGRLLGLQMLLPLLLVP